MKTKMRFQYEYIYSKISCKQKSSYDYMAHVYVWINTRQYEVLCDTDHPQYTW